MAIFTNLDVPRFGSLAVCFHVRIVAGKTGHRAVPEARGETKPVRSVDDVEFIFMLLGVGLVEI